MKYAVRNLMTFASAKINRFKEDERGDSNIVSIILIIVVVIGLVVIFRDGITDVMNKVIQQIKDMVDGV